jgi:outer membrane usher protein FimD/PapC
MENGKPPSYGELRLDYASGRAESPVAADGSFWLDGIPAGKYHAQVEFHDGFCNLDLRVPQSRERIVQVGVVRCNTDRVATAAITSPASR